MEISTFKKFLSGEKRELPFTQHQINGLIDAFKVEDINAVTPMKNQDNLIDIAKLQNAILQFD